MKKIYALMAAALVSGLTAAAKYDAGVAQTMTFDGNLMVAGMESKAGSMMKAPASAADATGYFMSDYAALFSADTGKGSIQIEINGKEAIVTGLFELAPLTGEFDAATGTIKIPVQETIYNGRESETDTNPKPIWFVPGTFVVDGDGKITGRTPSQYATLVYTPQGVTFGQEHMNDGGWAFASTADYFLLTFESNKNDTSMSFSGFGGGFEVLFPTIGEVYPECPAFEYVASEWENVGKAKLDDGWFRALTGQGYAPYDVDLLRNKTEKNHFLLLNPYGVNTPYGTQADENNQTPEAQGYIYINADRKDCVLVRPMVNSGFSNFDFFGGGNMTCTDKDAFSFYLGGYGYDDILDEAEIYGDPVSSFEGNVLTLPYCRIQQPGSLRAVFQYSTSDNKAIAMESQITFPANAFAGVEGIYNDTENVAKRYFNLQGVEIANPEAGQVVIVKEGNKASKTIVR